MGRFVRIIMYLMWMLTIVFVLSTTFTNFEYEDLNLLAVFFLLFSVVNSFFILSRHRKNKQ